MKGFLVVLAFGLVVLAVAAVHDRRARLAAERAGALPSTAGRPVPPVPDADARAALEAFRAAHEHLDATLAHPAFATWSKPWAAELSDVEVLCCAEAPASPSELVGSRAVARRRMRPLLVVSPSLDDVTLPGLAVTADGGLVVLRATPEVVEQVAGVVTARPATRADLQSGASGNFHGRAAHVVADEQGAWFAPVEG